MKADIAIVDRVLRMNDQPVPEGGDHLQRVKRARCWSRKVWWDVFHTNWTGLWPEDVDAMIKELEEYRIKEIDRLRGKTV